MFIVLWKRLIYNVVIFNPEVYNLFPLCSEMNKDKLKVKNTHWKHTIDQIIDNISVLLWNQ